MGIFTEITVPPLPSPLQRKQSATNFRPWVRQHQVIKAHPTALEIMGDYGTDNEEQYEDFSQIEGEAYYAQHGGDLNGGKSLPHGLVMGLVWERRV